MVSTQKVLYYVMLRKIIFLRIDIFEWLILTLIIIGAFISNSAARFWLLFSEHEPPAVNGLTWRR